MQVTVVGCSGTFPGPLSPCSAYLFEADGYRMLVDAGNGATGVLQRWTGLLDIDAVVLSHLHGDHYLDLVTYTYARRYHPDGPSPPLPVYGPDDVGGHLAGAFGRPVGQLLAEVYEFHRVAPGRLDVGPFHLELVATNHPVETYGMRITEGGRTVSYSADSGPTDALLDLARGADLFLCEASYLDDEDNPPGIHLTGREAGDYAARGGAGRLLLTHLVPWGDPERSLAAARQVFDGDVELAATGWRCSW